MTHSIDYRYTIDPSMTEGCLALLSSKNFKTTKLFLPIRISFMICLPERALKGDLKRLNDSKRSF